MTEAAVGTPAGFLFDFNQCTGCQACELACAIENGLGDASWRQVVTLNEEHRPGVPTMHLSLACSHCAEPPCMEHCPALAYRKDPRTGRVELDGDLCIGCGYCSWACPYDAPRLDASAGVMTKCTFCGHRQDEGLAPACVEQCPTGALRFGELGALPGVPDAPGLPTLAPGPSVRFIPWESDRAEARGSGLEREAPEETVMPPTPRKISLHKEWPLVVFTLLAPLLFALFTARALGAFELSPLAFLAVAAIGMGASTAHLGRPLRAWRAMLNVRRSWLSREIVLFSGFVALATAYLATAEQVGSAAQVLAWIVIATGAAALFAVDRVYDVVRPERARPLHSADVVLTAVLLTAAFLGNLALAGATVLFKAVLYLRRKRRRPGRWRTADWGWSLGRLGVGVAGPVGLALATPTGWTGWAMTGLAVGEILDRCELYGELEVPTPRGEMARELTRRLDAEPPARGST